MLLVSAEWLMYILSFTNSQEIKSKECSGRLDTTMYNEKTSF